MYSRCYHKLQKRCQALKHGRNYGCTPVRSEPLIEAHGGIEAYEEVWNWSGQRCDFATVAEVFF
jgi:hypothetical protein